jgi:hypothetical protein
MSETALAHCVEYRNQDDGFLIKDYSQKKLWTNVFKQIDYTLLSITISLNIFWNNNYKPQYFLK